MRISPIKAAACAIFVLHLPAANNVLAQAVREQLPSTYFPTKMLCTDSPFVAMVRLGPPRLVVIRIGRNGIEDPKTLPLNDQVYGMKCGYRRVELLVREDESDHFTRLPFTIRDDTIQQGQPQQIDYSISGKGPTPPELDDFHKIAMALKNVRGDWHVQLIGVPVKHLCELHFVKTETRSRNGLTTRFSVDLLEETSDRKIIKAVRLIREENFEAAD